MVAISLPFRGHDLSTSSGYNTDLPQDQYQQEQQSQSHANPWVSVLDTDHLVLTCCEDGSPYHKLICGHLIHTSRRGCGRTCRTAVNSTERLRPEFNCDRCADEQTFADVMEHIRIFWSAAVLDNRIILVKHLQPYIDAFEHQLGLGREAGISSRGRKAFARTDDELVENFQVQIENLIERSCRYHLDLLMKKRGSEMYDEPGDDYDYEEELGEQLLDDTEEGEVIEDGLYQDMGGRDEVNVPKMAATLSLKPHSKSAAGVDHNMGIVESLIGSIDFDDSFGSVEEAMEAEGDWLAAQEESPLKRGRDSGFGAGEELDDVDLASPGKKARF